MLVEDTVPVDIQTPRAHDGFNEATDARDGNDTESICALASMRASMKPPTRADGIQTRSIPPDNGQMRGRQTPEAVAPYAVLTAARTVLAAPFFFFAARPASLRMGAVFLAGPLRYVQLYVWFSEYALQSLTTGFQLAHGPFHPLTTRSSWLMT